MSFRICKLLNTNQKPRQEEAGIKINRNSAEHPNCTSPCSGCSYASSLNNYDNDVKSSCPRRSSWVVVDSWFFNPSAWNFLSKRFAGLALWWLGSHPAQQSFGQHPSWPNDFHSCLAFPGRPTPPVQQTAAWAGMPTTQEHSGLKCFGMVVASARNYPAKEVPWTGLGA